MSKEKREVRADAVQSGDEIYFNGDWWKIVSTQQWGSMVTIKIKYGNSEITISRFKDQVQTVRR